MKLTHEIEKEFLLEMKVRELQILRKVKRAGAKASSELINTYE